MQNATILIVDDAPENLSILGELLSDYNVKVAKNGEKALQIALSETPPNLILLDIVMPGMDGFDVCRKLKQNDSTYDIPVIFMTSLNATEDKVKGFEVGAVDYVTKPIQGEELQARVQTHLTLHFLQKEMKIINRTLEERVNERTAELKIAKEKAEESSRLKSHFLSLMSHELRTPMNGILGYSEILSLELDDQQLKEYADGIYDSGKRLKETLNSIINLSRLESNKLEVFLSDINIVERVRALLKSHESISSKKKINLRFNSSQNEIISKLDKTMFDIVINNLIDNAIKYTHEGNVTVEIKTEKVKSDSYVIIDVKDTGIGIPKDKFKVIFEEFRQVDEGQGRNFEGVGLGLAITKKLTKKLKGQIFVESEVGRGSIFRIKLPIIEIEEIQVAAPPKKVAKPSIKKTNNKMMLIVEDEDITINVTKLFLKKYGELEVAKSGEQALEMVGQKQYDIILMDINLGKGLNGLETTKEIRKIKNYKTIPIIAVTAYALDSDKEQFLKEGCSHYLPKPYTKNDLFEIMDSILKEK